MPNAKPRVPQRTQSISGKVSSSAPGNDDIKVKKLQHSASRLHSARNQSQKRSESQKGYGQMQSEKVTPVNIQHKKPLGLNLKPPHSTKKADGSQGKNGENLPPLNAGGSRQSIQVTNQKKSA
jgi:hypothetical protein